MHRILRLKKRQQFSAVFQRGHSYGDRNLVLFVLSGSSEPYHVGFAVQRKVGTAVKRNRVRRRLRALVDALTDEMRPVGDMIWLGKVPVLTISWPELMQSGRRVLKKAGCLAKESGRA